MKTRTYLFSFGFGVLGTLITLIIYTSFFQSKKMSGYNATSQQTLAQYAKYLPEGTVNFTAASAMATPAVVHIQSTGQSSMGQSRENPLGDFPFRDFFEFDFPSPGPSASSGSGVIISKDGYIVTNNHVIDHADEIEVTLLDNRTYKASVIGTDPTTDLALLKIDESELPYLSFGNSDQLLVGEWVLAVGNPFNLTSTVTAGIVSAKGRNIGILNDRFKIESFIQTDAAVNPGNSGGALINIKGELVGINTAIASRTGSYSGYSFAVPATMVKKVIDDLKKYGEVQRAFLGVMIRDVDSKLAEEENLSTTKGVYITEVNDNSAAQEAGIKKGDIIIKVNGKSVNNSSELQEQIGRKRPGDQVHVTLLRGEDEKELDVVLKNKSGTTNIVTKESTSLMKKLGADFDNLSKDELAEYDIKFGVKVSNIRYGKFRSAGISEGFVITHVDKEPVKSKADILDTFDSKEGAILIEGVYPDGKSAAYAVMF